MKPGSPLSVKVLSRQGPPVSMGVWSLGSSPDKWTEILHQDKQNKMLRRCQPFELQAGTSGPCILSCRITSRGLKVQGRQLSSIESSVDTTWTSHLFRRHALQPTYHCERKTTPSSGKENKPMNPVYMKWGLPSRTPCSAQPNNQQMDQNAFCPSVCLHHQAQ